MNLKEFAIKSLKLIYKAGDNTVEHDGIEHAGFLSFMLILSLFPFLVFFFSILGVLGETQLGKELIYFLLSNANVNIVEAVTPAIDELLNGPPQGLLTISILGAIWTSSSMVEGLRTVLNRAYHVRTPPNYWLRRAFSIGQIMVLTVILVLAMFSLVFAPIAFEKIYGFFQSFNDTSSALGSSERIEFNAERFEFLGVKWKTIRISGIILILLFFVSSLFYFLPNVKQRWRLVLPGAIIVVAGWFSVAKAFSYYLSHFDRLNLIYGSLGSIIAFLLFFYVIITVFIYGAEFNYLIERTLGGKVEEREKVKPQDVKKGEERNKEDKQDVAGIDVKQKKKKKNVGKKAGK